MLIDRNSKNEFVLNCFRELLDDGEPHRYREIIDYVREQAKGTQYEGTIEQNNLVLDILFVVQRQMEVIHKTQQEEFSSSKTLENSFQVVSDHLETLLDSMSMWIADMEDLTQVPLQEHENEDLTGMQMG